MQIEINDHFDVRSGIKIVSQQIERVRKHKTFALDATVRHLKSCAQSNLPEALNISIEVNDFARQSDQSQQSGDAGLVIRFSETNLNKQNLELE